MGDELRSLDCEDEFIRRLLAPLLEALRPLCGVEGSIQLNRVELPRGELKFAALRQVFWIESATPVVVAPSRHPDADFSLVAHLAFDLAILLWRRATPACAA